MGDQSRAVILLLFLSVALGMPGMAGMDDALVAKADSGVWANLWLTHAAAKAFIGGGPPLSANPDLDFLHTVNLWPYLNGVLWPALMSPFYLFAGPVFAHNLSGILALFLTSVCSYFFFRKVCGTHAPALISAVLFGFGTNSIHDGNPARAAFFAIPLTALFILRLAENPSPRILSLVILSIAVSFATSIVLGIGSILFLLFYLPVAAGKIGAKKAFLYFTTAVMAGLILALPILWPILKARASISPSMASSIFGSNWINSPEKIGLFWNLIYGSLAGIFFITVLGGLFRAQKGYRFWVISGLGFVLLSPLHMVLSMLILAQKGSFWMSVFPWIGGLVDFWVDILSFASICFFAAFSITLTRLLAAVKKKNWPEPVIGRAGIIAAVILTLLPFSQQATGTEIPKAYRFLATQKTPGALIELPIECDVKTRPWMSGRLFYQMTHGKPVVAGRVLPGIDGNELHGSLFQALTQCPDKAEQDDKSLENAIRPEDAAGLAAQGVAFVMIHNAEAGAMPLNWIAMQAFGAPIYEDDGESLYQVKGTK